MKGKMPSSNEEDNIHCCLFNAGTYEGSCRCSILLFIVVAMVRWWEVGAFFSASTQFRGEGPPVQMTRIQAIHQPATIVSRIPKHEAQATIT